MQVDWNGIYPAITTKFNSDGSLDLHSFEKSIKNQIEAGVHGIVLGGTLGEASTLKNGEKLQLVKKTLELVDNKIPVIMNIAEQTTEAAVESAQNAQKNGAAGLMILPPMRYKADEYETLTFFKEIAASTNLPIMIYNNPIDYGILVTIGMFEELIEYKNIQAVKESTRDVTNVTKMINRFGERLKILCGVDTLALESLFLGAHGWVAGLVCAFPKETVAIYNLVQENRFEDALKIYRWFIRLLELDVHSKLVQNIKLAETAMGLGTEHVRKPRLKLMGEERIYVQNIIKKALENREEILYLIDKQKYI